MGRVGGSPLFSVMFPLSHAHLISSEFKLLDSHVSSQDMLWEVLEQDTTLLAGLILCIEIP